MPKLKYPLTPEGKEAAKLMVAAWEDHQIDQTFYLLDVTSGNAHRIELSPGLGADDTFQSPSLGNLHELAEYHLIRFDHVFTARTDRFEVTLLQELRNAVLNDFEVSDFFLTTQAVGTIINAAENSNVLIPSLQSAASVFGDIDQTQINTAPELAAKLVQVLGKDILDSNPDLAEAIRELETADEPKRRFQFGKVILELGRCLQHVAHAASVIQALALLALFAHSQGLW